MRIVIINLVSAFEDDDLVYPIGPAQVAAQLSRAHEVRVVDQNLAPENLEVLKSVVRDFSPDLIGVSIRNLDNTIDERSHLPAQQAAVRALRAQVGQGFPIVGGGSGFGLFPKSLPEALPELDGTAWGYGAEPIEAVARLGLQKAVDQGFINHGSSDEPLTNASPGFHPDPADPFALFPAGPYLGRNRYFPAFGVETRRGCSETCAYCPYPILQSRQIHLRPLDRILADVEALARRGVRRFFLIDPVVNLASDHLEKIIEGLQDLGGGFQWQAWFREKGLTSERLAYYRENGLETLSLSGDGMTDRQLDLLGKGMDIKDILDAALAAAESGIPTLYHFFTEVPGDDAEEDLPSKMDLLRKIYRLHRGKGNLARVLCHEIRIYPGTEIHRRAVGEGFLTGEENLLLPRFAERIGAALPGRS